MKMTLTLLALVCSVSAFASGTTYEYGMGTGREFCDGSNFSYCVEQVKDEAQRDAFRQAQNTCLMKGGYADSTYPSCTDNCSPYSLPSDAPSQQVYCSSDCTVRCEIR